jgi:allantoinase
MKAEPGCYDYWPYAGRPKITWPGGKRLAFWVVPNIEFYELDPRKNPHRAAWPHPYPAVPGYSIRDYGNRVGHMRQMRLLDKYGIRHSAPTIRKSSTSVLSATGSSLLTASTTRATPTA